MPARQPQVSAKGTSAGPARRSPARFEGDQTTQFAAITWRGTDTSTMQKHWFDDPTEALASAVEYLKRGYQVRLSDRTVAHYLELDRPPVGPAAVFMPPGGS
jgi:hypothetical protein